jgi:hypothetical protein
MEINVLMDTYIRNVYSITNKEIVFLVNDLFKDNGGNLELIKLAKNRFTINYRKIEFIYSGCEWSIFCKVTFGFKDSVERVTTAFGIDYSHDDFDFYLTPVNSATVGRNYLKMHGINFDFSKIEYGSKKLYKCI